MGLLTPARPREGEKHSAVERFEHRVHPIAAGIAVPIFALAAAGIPFSALGGVASEPIAIGVVCGLVIGKTVGVLGGGALAARLFEALAKGEVNIEMISTSEIKIAVILDEAKIVEAANLAHEAFGLAQA